MLRTEPGAWWALAKCLSSSVRRASFASQAESDICPHVLLQSSQKPCDGERRGVQPFIQMWKPRLKKCKHKPQTHGESVTDQTRPAFVSEGGKPWLSRTWQGEPAWERRDRPPLPAPGGCHSVLRRPGAGPGSGWALERSLLCWGKEVLMAFYVPGTERPDVLGNEVTGPGWAWAPASGPVAWGEQL